MIIKKYDYLIGIDCGVNTGFAIWNREGKKFFGIHTHPIHKAMERVRLWHEGEPGKVFVRVEDARLAKYGRENDFHKIKGAGSVMRDAKIWEDFLSDLKIDFQMVRPNKSLTKLDAKTFKNLTGYTETTSVHARDAAMLVFGF